MQNFFDLKNQTFNSNSINNEEKYKRNKLEIMQVVDSCTTKTSNDKEFYKALFKIMDEYLEEADEVVFNKLGLFMDLPILTKVILFLKYRETSNYRDKIKMIKELSKGVTLDMLLLYEKYIIDELNFLADHSTNHNKTNILTAFKYSDSIDEDIFRAHLLLFKNTALILKCVLFNYHKRELMFVEDGKPKYKIVPIKNIYTFDYEFKIGADINPNELVSLLKLLEKDKNEIIYSVTPNVAGAILCAYFKENLIHDDYNKYLLDKTYHEKVSNRISRFLDSNSFMLSSNFIMKRKVLIPKNGVIILVENEESPIQSILLSEKEMLGYNNLYFITRYKDGTEVINSIILNTEFTYNATVYGNVIEFDNNYFNTLSYLLDFLGINPQTKDKLLKYNVISPRYWKYRHNGYVSNNDKVDSRGVVIKREFEIEIAPFLRRINGEPSTEAITLANKLGVILEKGYTIVKPHTRTYNKLK